MTRRIGIYGGTFNPVHQGHLIAAADAVEGLSLDRLYWMPSARPPHKSDAALASAAHRCAMIEAAIAGHPRMALSRWEIRRGGVSYTIDTIRAFRRRFPDAGLHFIIGADSLYELHLWCDIEALLDACAFAVVARPGYRIDRRRIRLAPARARALARSLVPSHDIGISSTEIRNRLARGRSIRYLVPLSVEAYLRRHRLYGRRPASAVKTEERGSKA